MILLRFAFSLILSPLPRYFSASVLGNIQALPTDGKPVISNVWHSPDDAFFDVAEGIRKVVEEISKLPIPQSSESAKEVQSDSSMQRGIKEQEQSLDHQTIKKQ